MSQYEYLTTPEERADLHDYAEKNAVVRDLLADLETALRERADLMAQAAAAAESARSLRSTAEGYLRDYDFAVAREQRARDRIHELAEDRDALAERVRELEAAYCHYNVTGSEYDSVKEERQHFAARVAELEAESTVLRRKASADEANWRNYKASNAHHVKRIAELEAENERLKAAPATHRTRPLTTADRFPKVGDRLVVSGSECTCVYSRPGNEATFETPEGLVMWRGLAWMGRAAFRYISRADGCSVTTEEA